MDAATPTPPSAARGLLPPALWLPAAAGAIVFAVAVGTTQVALQITNRQADRQVELLAQVYLDGIASSVRAGLEARDRAEVLQGFARAFTEQRGVTERALFAFLPDGTLLARAGDAAIPDAAAAAFAADAWRLDPASGTAWAAREVAGAAAPAGRVVAALDIAPILAARGRLSWGVVLVDLLIAGLCAVLTWRVLGRLGRPLGALVRALSGAAHQAPAPLPQATLAAADARSAAVLRAYNRMVDSVRERERLRAELADRDQAAALGRLAATIAHEVRNPLGGLAAAVSTLRRFGADQAAREEAVAFLERGIGALERIVTATLEVYRPEQDRPLARSDLEDLHQLVRPEAERRGVRLGFALDLPAGEIAQGAGAVRQVLLNLLLNACAATPPGGTVGFRAWREDDALVCEIADEGPGLSPAQAARLAGGDAAADPDAAAGDRRLGLGVVVGLLGSLDARATVVGRVRDREAGSAEAQNGEVGGGTVIRLAIPLGAAGRA